MTWVEIKDKKEFDRHSLSIKELEDLVKEYKEKGINKITFETKGHPMEKPTMSIKGFLFIQGIYYE